MIVLSSKKKIPFQIDPDDYEAVSWYNWYIDPQGYPRTSVGKAIKGRPSTKRWVRLHNFLMGPAPIGFCWDHMNRDKRDNRRVNLRAVTHKANMRNVNPQKNNTSGTRGVSWVSSKRKWRAYIKSDGTMKQIGYFRSLENAVIARVEAERTYWGSER